jgi:hypothetical protein
VEARFANMPRCLIGMEACVGAHHLSRRLRLLGHDARLMPAKYVRPMGTIFEYTSKNLRDWFRVIHLMLTSKKSISALQVMRYMGSGSYKSAWYIRRRIRTWMKDPEFRKLMGIVEPNEAFIGGKARR